MIFVIFVDVCVVFRDFDSVVRVFFLEGGEGARGVIKLPLIVNFYALRSIAFAVARKHVQVDDTWYAHYTQTEIQRRAQ